MSFLHKAKSSASSCVVGIYRAIDIQDVLFFCGLGVLWYGSSDVWGIGIANVITGGIMILFVVLFQLINRRVE